MRLVAWASVLLSGLFGVGLSQTKSIVAAIRHEAASLKRRGLGCRLALRQNGNLPLFGERAEENIVIPSEIS